MKRAALWFGLAACAHTRGGDFLCGGRNDKGQLGDGTATDRATAAPVVW